MAIFIALTSYTSIPPTIIVEGVYLVIPTYTIVPRIEVQEIEETTFVESSVCDNPYNCCVTYLREIRGIPIRGDADTITPNINEPVTGVVVIFNYNGTYHVAEVGYILIDRFQIAAESNFEHSGKESSGRVVMMNDTHIIGYRYVNPNLQFGK